MLLFLLQSLASCQTRVDCALNGDCVEASCRCDVPWIGETCDKLDILPVDNQTHPGASVYGWHPNVSSWGGSVVYSSDDSRWHLFASQMRNGGLVGWETESECVHAVASTADGPFNLSDVAVDAECHGPAVVRDPSGEMLMFHQGDTGYLHHAPSMGGPWTRVEGAPDCGMPSAAFHPNGTLFLVCGNGARLVRAGEGGWNAGEWYDVPTVDFNRPSGWEDPTLWFDRTGAFHILWHVYNLEPYEAHLERCSGHSYSRDGLAWRFSGEDEPFDGTLRFVDGSSQALATRERPQLVFADLANRTQPIGLTNGVSSQPLGPWCEDCYLGACSQCKISEGRDWTYTTFVWLRSASAR